ncbi:pyroglutamyl-peptidase I [Massilia sp. KIM]|uniref:pyroglutamyl-peptidase I n=1 Tax=Massilia sp. KIM TaxID=1955422 RepID=UPI00098E9374|nr:pyroglutamyl-peptidase I [Massilia sp. KIM]OON64237.1 pyroglutamyl-peptidase I [Massilia sp. KIM]
MTKTVLLTGFEPFNQATVNPAWEAVRALEGWRGEGFAVQVRQLPCVFGAAIASIARAVDELRPDIVIAVGQAGGRPDISVERVAINVDDAAILDNAGLQPVDTPVVDGGPAAYFSTLPIKAIVRAVRERGIPASVSQTAGTFVCNHLFYGLMHHVAGRGLKAGFIHVPFLPEQVEGRPDQPPSMALDDIIAAIRVAVEVSLAVERDLAETGGATH